MKSFRQYLGEAAESFDNPRAGDTIELEISHDEVIETTILERNGEEIIIEGDGKIFALLEKHEQLQERIARYGAVGSNRAMGYTLEEGDIDPNQHPQSKDYREGGDEQEDLDEDYMSRMLELAGCKRMEETAPYQPETNAAHTDPLAAKAADLAPVGVMKDPGTAATIDEGVMSEIDIDLQSLADRGDEEDLIAGLEGDLGPGTAIVLRNMLEDLKDELASKGMTDVINDEDKMIEILFDKIVDEYSGRDLDEDGVDPVNAMGQDAEQLSGNMTAEAEYQGRKVPLGKPMRGDVKKFKVYVKDPKTGNIKKVNFGHGGKSARRAGQKTLRIKKSNPARRKSFRARHRCDTAKDRTSARYWSCRMW